MYLRLAIVLLVSITLSQGRKCRWSEFYQAPTQDLEKGTCVKCPTCELGQGWDKKFQRNTNDTLGFLDCYPCKQCDDNYYRNTDRRNDCSLCKKDCESGNRTTAVKCGGVNIGSCGDCFQGFVPANQLEKESICMPDPAKTTTALLDINLDVNLKNVNTVHNHGISIEIMIVIGALLVVVVAAVLICKHRNKREKGTLSANVINSGTGLLSGSTGSADSALTDVDTDGPPAPRGELPQSVDESSIGFAEIHEEPTQRAGAVLVNPRGVPSGQSRHGLSATVKQGRNRTLSKNDRVLDIVASNIGVKGLLEVYRSLGITNATYEPEEDLYRQGRQSFKSYVLNVLLEWLKHDGKTATLERLCYALDRAGCRETVDAVQQYIKENMPELSTQQQHVHKEQGSWPKLELSELIDDIDGDPVS